MKANGRFGRGPAGRARRLRRIKPPLLAAVALVAVGVSGFLYDEQSLRRLDLDTVDLRFAVRGEQPAPPNLVVVAIDAASFEFFDRRFQDWPRTYHARVLRNLKRAGARVISYDVQFTEQSRNPAHDNALILAVEAARPVILATTETIGPRGQTAVLGGEELLRSVGARAGHALFPDDPNGVIRRLPYSVDGLKTLAVAVTEVERRRPLPRPTGTLWIDYAGPAGTIKRISFGRVYANRFPRSAVRGRTVLVGPTAPSLQDVHPTPFSSEGQMAGAEIQANAIQTARSGFPLRSAAGGWNVLAIVLLGLVPGLASLLLPALRAFAVAVLGGVVFAVVAQLVFEGGHVIAGAYPLVALVIAAVGSLGVDYFTETRERRRVRQLFARFVPETVVDQVVQRADDDLRLGGTRLESTVLFSDLRGFTSFAESLSAEEVIDVLNHYLGEMSEAILNHGGTLVSYMGDGIMAVFGAPLEQSDHADRALAAAREMLFVRLPRFNEWIASGGVDHAFRMGIGLNSGLVMSGNVGSARRLEYTAVGDTTNTASRLEALTKGTPYQLFISDRTRELLHGGADELVLHGDADIRGRQQKMRLWVLREEAERAGVATEPGTAPAEAPAAS